ncbi:NrfD/PsrC family molybdoenzyme membrane anchor subunit [Chloroflexota bacterium]
MWGVPIVVYLWLAGMAGGIYFAAFVADCLTLGGKSSLTRLAVYIATIFLIPGLILVIMDLGHPIYFWKMLLRFRVMSPMSMGVWILLLFLVLSVIMGVFWRIEYFVSKQTVQKLHWISTFFTWIGLVFSILIMVYCGVILATSNRPLWAGLVILPPLFAASATSTGMSMLISLAMLANTVCRSGSAKVKLAMNRLLGSTDWIVPSRTISSLTKANTLVILVEAIVLVSYVIQLSVSTMAGKREALMLLIAGEQAAPFWLGMVVIALIVPLWLGVANWNKEIDAKGMRHSIIAFLACVVLGGLIMRWVIVLGGQHYCI